MESKIRIEFYRMGVEKPIHSHPFQIDTFPFLTKSLMDICESKHLSDSRPYPPKPIVTKWHFEAASILTEDAQPFVKENSMVMVSRVMSQTSIHQNDVAKMLFKISMVMTPESALMFKMKYF